MSHCLSLFRWPVSRVGVLLPAVRINCAPYPLLTPSPSPWGYGHTPRRPFLPLPWAEEEESLSPGLFPLSRPGLWGGAGLAKGCSPGTGCVQRMQGWAGLWGERSCRVGKRLQAPGAPGQALGLFWAPWNNNQVRGKQSVNACEEINGEVDSGMFY